MQLHASCAKGSLSYEQADTFSDLMNTVFNANTTAETFITDNDEECNKAIDFYDKFQSILEGLDDVRRESIISFCKSVYFGGNCVNFKINGFIFYGWYLEMLIRYINGQCDFDTVRGWLIDMKPWCPKPKKVDSKIFRRDFNAIEQLYALISQKKAKRLGKKIVLG